MITSRRLVFSFLLLVLTIIFGSSTAAASNNFTKINANATIEVANIRLLFVTSKHGFIHHNENDSPLYSDIPTKIGSSSKVAERSTVIVQSIKTKIDKTILLEGGLPGGKWVWIIVGGVLGLIVAPFLKQNPILGAIVGATAVLLFVSYLFEYDNFKMYVDNATDLTISLEVDNLSPVIIPPFTQLAVIFKEGTRHVKTIKASDNSVIEQFDLQATKYRDSSDSTISGYYIYNVQAKNKYSFHHPVYSPE